MLSRRQDSNFIKGIEEGQDQYWYLYWHQKARRRVNRQRENMLRKRSNSEFETSRINALNEFYADTSRVQEVRDEYWRTRHELEVPVGWDGKDHMKGRVPIIDPRITEEVEQTPFGEDLIAALDVLSPLERFLVDEALDLRLEHPRRVIRRA